MPNWPSGQDRGACSAWHIGAQPEQRLDSLGPSVEAASHAGGDATATDSSAAVEIPRRLSRREKARAAVSHGRCDDDLSPVSRSEREDRMVRISRRKAGHKSAEKCAEELSRHTSADCVASTDNYSDWIMSTRLMEELFPVRTNRKVDRIKFVEWAIRHMARTGCRPTTKGTAHCGGHTKHELRGAFDVAHPELLKLPESVFNNKKVPTMGILSRFLWSIAPELITNTRARRLGLDIAQHRLKTPRLAERADSAEQPKRPCVRETRRRRRCSRRRSQSPEDLDSEDEDSEDEASEDESSARSSKRRRGDKSADLPPPAGRRHRRRRHRARRDEDDESHGTSSEGSRDEGGALDARPASRRCAVSAVSATDAPDPADVAQRPVKPPQRANPGAPPEVLWYRWRQMEP
jgi:hypothetical protein